MEVSAFEWQSPAIRVQRDCLEAVSHSLDLVHVCRLSHRLHLLFPNFKSHDQEAATHFTSSLCSRGSSPCPSCGLPSRAPRQVSYSRSRQRGPASSPGCSMSPSLPPRVLGAFSLSLLRALLWPPIEDRGRAYFFLPPRTPSPQVSLRWFTILPVVSCVGSSALSIQESFLNKHITPQTACPYSPYLIITYTYAHIYYITAHHRSPLLPHFAGSLCVYLLFDEHRCLIANHLSDGPHGPVLLGKGVFGGI